MAEAHADGPRIMSDGSKYYVAGNGAVWRGVVEVRPDEIWFYHKEWPRRNPHSRGHVRDLSEDHIGTGYWVRWDEDLDMDTGL